eukprot:NODE_538_length_6985_cov_0.287892.p4 type:complete len:146 gc:universal NODE_538_length_6985_cov_0.287892:792-355(-)
MLMVLISIVTAIFYIDAGRESVHVPEEYRFYSKSKLKIYPKTCLGIPRVEMRLLKRGLNTFKIHKDKYDDNFKPIGNCYWWIADRNTQSSSLLKIGQNCLLDDYVHVNLDEIPINCEKCVLRLSVIINHSTKYNGYFDSCIDFSF